MSLPTVGSIPRALAAALAGAAIGTASLVTAFASHPALTLDMNQERLPMLSGFFEPETAGALSFAWTRGRADVLLNDLNRSAPWRCTVRLRGARPPGLAQPAVDLSVDGVTVARLTATNEFQDASVVVPESTRAGVRLTIASTPTFRAPPDDREFGVQVDSVICRPATSAFAWPAKSVIGDAAISAATWGAAVGLAGLTAGTSIAVTAVVAMAQALPLAAGAAPYTGHAGRAPWLALWIGLGVVLAVKVIARVRREPLSAAARFVVVVSGVVLHLKLLALLHPGKPIVDGIFNAHNLGKVLAGQFFFVQSMPGHVQFPYAVALYVFAAPWSALAHSDMDRVALLRIIVCAADVIAGACLYWMVVRARGDRLAGVAAVLLYQWLPVSYGMQGNANLPNAFGQSVALVAVAVATNWSFERRRLGQLSGLVLITTVAFLSHVSVAASLLATLLALAVLYGWVSPPLRPQARAVLVATLVAALLAAGLYYGRWDHFGDAYVSVQRARAASGAAPATAPTAGVLQLQASFRPVLGLTQIISDLGWPMLLLSIVGTWRVWTWAARDRLVRALLAWAVALAVFFAFGVLAPTSAEMLRYTLEFISRADYAAAPAAIILAGVAYGWAWRAGTAARVAAVVLLLWAAITGVLFWSAWFQ